MYKEAVVDGPVRYIFLDKRINEFSILSLYRLVVFPYCSFMNEQMMCTLLLHVYNCHGLATQNKYIGQYFNLIKILFPDFFSLIFAALVCLIRLCLQQPQLQPFLLFIFCHFVLSITNNSVN